MSKISPVISIIVPCYNQAQYLPETLQSVLEQDYRHWECIIINDGSPDNTEEVALEWCSKDERFKYFKKENGGLSDARNYGIKHSVGKYILPLDSDDKISKDYTLEAINVGLSYLVFTMKNGIYCHIHMIICCLCVIVFIVQLFTNVPIMI